MERLTGAQARALEPGLNAHAAILSPESGVFASHDYMLALQGEIEAPAARWCCRHRSRGRAPAGRRLHGAGGEGGATSLTCRLLVTAPGLSAQDVAGRIEGFPADRIPAGHFGKGVYFRLTGKAPFERLIYPPPIHGALGTHYRKDLGGQAVFGPDLEYVETEDYSVDPAKAEEFAAISASSGRACPTGPDARLRRHPAQAARPGRAAARLPAARREDHGIEGLMALFGIESPGLTSSLAIGEAVAERLAGRATASGSTSPRA
jgi:L-2-hydroxyglutarate oxidase LhgO